MNSEDIKEVIDYLVGLGGELYPVLQQQVKYNAVLDSFWLGLSFVIFIAAIFITIRIVKYIKNDGDIAAICISVIIFAISIGGLISNGARLLNYLMNPNWMVIQLLMDQIK
jgi:hypothetical protein